MFHSIAVCTCALIAIQAVAARPQDAPAAAAAAGSSTPIPIVSQTEVVGPDGSFNYSYESGNGIKFEQSGYVKKAPADAAKSGELRETDEDDDIQVLQGSYSYTAPDGQQIKLKYIADENGFQPEGDHLPTTPAAPAGFQGALAAAAAPAGEQEASQAQPQPAAQAAEPAAPAAEEASAAPSAESTPAP